jgi:CheY-like chemotaxis protein
VVEAASDGEQALDRARGRRPALVLLDWGLPILGGPAVAAAIQASHERSVPIVLITADGRAAEKAREVGAREYLSKPFDVEDLVAVVRRTLDQG